MLFDLEGRRKTVIKIVYLGLALLMGGGLVLFGIGGQVNGGLFDAFSGGGGGGSGRIEKKIEQLEARIRVNPKDETALGDLVRQRFALAASGDNYKGDQYSATGLSIMRQVEQDWTQYAAVAKRPRSSIAQFAVQAFATSQNFNGAVGAQRAITRDRPTAQAYLQLVQFAIFAGDRKTADRGAKRAIALAPKSQRSQLKQQIKIFKLAAKAIRQKVQVTAPTGSKGASPAVPAGAGVGGQ